MKKDIDKNMPLERGAKKIAYRGRNRDKRSLRETRQQMPEGCHAEHKVDRF